MEGVQTATLQLPRLIFTRSWLGLGIVHIQNAKTSISSSRSSSFSFQKPTSALTQPRENSLIDSIQLPWRDYINHYKRQLPSCGSTAQRSPRRNKKPRWHMEATWPSVSYLSLFREVVRRCLLGSSRVLVGALMDIVCTSATVKNENK